jgi:HPt (histidine-containing phosphotransfer) domain-containing protein
MSDYISKPIGPDELFSKLLMYTEGNEIHHTRDEFNKSSEVSSNIISTDDILRNLRGNQNLYKKFLKRYLSVYQDLPANIEEEFSTKKYKRIERIAHDLKNAFGTIGAFAYIEKARKIENLVAMNKIDEADKIIPSFVAELRLLNREVERILFGDD